MRRASFRRERRGSRHTAPRGTPRQAARLPRLAVDRRTAEPQAAGELEEEEKSTEGGGALQA